MRPNHFILTMLAAMLCTISLYAQRRDSIAVFFSPGKREITPASKQRIDNLLTSMPHFVAGFHLKGHADSTGSIALNDRLSLRRAKTVKAYLASKGVDTNNIIVYGYGERKPAFPNSRKSRWRNRRVDIIVQFPDSRKPETVVHAVDTPQVETNTLEIRKPDCFPEKDTVIIGKYGLRVEIKACSMKEFKCLQLNEVVNTDQMLQQGYTTTTTNGELLISAGMFQLVDCEGRPLGCVDSAVKYYIPASRIRRQSCVPCDRWGIYRAAGSNGAITWGGDPEPLETETLNGIEYYVFYSNCFGGFNCDCPVKTVPIKIRSKKYKLTDARLVFPANNAILYQRINSHKAKFRIMCTDCDSARLYAKALDKNGRKVEMNDVALMSLPHQKSFKKCRTLKKKFLFMNINKGTLPRKYYLI